MGEADRRKHPRVPFEAPAFLELDSKIVFGEVKDVSVNGMYMNVRGDYEADKPAEISIYFLRGPVTLSVTVPGRIARIGEDGVGFSSPHIDPMTLLGLDSFLAFASPDAPTSVMEEFIINAVSQSAGGAFLVN